MAASDLQFRLTGGATNTDPNLSLGGVKSSTVMSVVSLNNLFDNVSANECNSGDTEYRCLSIYNNGDRIASSITLWIDTNTPSGDSTIAIGVEPSTTQSVVSEGTAPTGVSFSTPGVGTELSVSNIDIAAESRVWIRRTISVGAYNFSNDSFVLAIQYA